MFNIRDQVVVKQKVSRSGPTTNQIKVGTVMAVGDDSVTVSFPMPGGMARKEIVPIAQCEPVTEVFRRNSVHTNPAFRQIYKGAV